MFITLEGIEGAGKTTLARRLAERLEDAGHKTLVTREPGGSALGTELRSLLLRTDSIITPSAELFLFLADRAQHVQEVIAPALASDTTVICDRYVDSTLVYQGQGRGFDIRQLRELCALATGNLWPDLTFVLDLDVRQGLERAAQRHQHDDTLALEGRFEAESISFHEEIRNGFKQLAYEDPQRMVVLDAAAGAREVVEGAWKILRNRGLLA